MGHHRHRRHLQRLGNGHVPEHVCASGKGVGAFDGRLLPSVVRLVGPDIPAHHHRLHDLRDPDSRRGDHDDSQTTKGRPLDCLYHGLVVSLGHSRGFKSPVK